MAVLFLIEMEFLCSISSLRMISIVQGSFDDDSLKVAELLVKNGFKEAYAIKGGVRGKEGWQVG